MSDGIQTKEGNNIVDEQNEKSSEKMEENKNSTNTEPVVPRALDKGVKTASIIDEMKKSYIDYAMSVIVSRALPDVRDGLKPVQRRIIYAMFREGILPGSSYSKSMGVIGEVLKKYHPHGDAAVYDALARLTQPWTMRYPLIDGQGNFGSVDGDSPAASRYTECRLQKISMYLVKDIGKKTVNFEPNYSGQDTEPSVLPTQIPNLIINGANGIAVGMATNIPPHNLTEILDGISALVRSGNQIEEEFNFSKYSAQDYYEAEEYDIESKGIKYPKFIGDLETKGLLKYIQGPDFPTYGEIIRDSNFEQCYETGKGGITVRGITKIEETKKGKLQIVITELPYQVNKANLAEKIFELLKVGKLENISDIRDESAREDIRLVIELKKGANAQILLNKLYKFTELQTRFNLNTLAIVNGRPRTLGIKSILEEFIGHRYEVTIRSKIFDLNANKQRAHILEGLKIALDHIDEIIKIIRSSETAEVAKTSLIKAFKFTDVQAQEILNMQLRKLANLERKKIEDEYKTVLAEIENLIQLLDSREKMEELILGELENVKEKFGDKRRTKVIKNSSSLDVSDEELIDKEDIIITISKSGYIKRVKSKEFRVQSRGGKGSIGSKTKTGDLINHILFCNTHTEILIFSNLGKVYSIKAHEIPEYSRQSKGLPLVNILALNQGEYVTSLLSKDYKQKDVNFVDEDITQEGETKLENEGRDYKYLFMTTKFGIVKKVDIGSFADIRKNGLITISLANGDELLFVRPTTGESDVLILSKKGKTVRFSESKVRQLGRTSKGMRGIKLVEEDKVVMMDIVRNKEDRLLVVAEKGYGKVTDLKEFPTKGRGTKGMIGYKITSKTGDIAAARTIDHPKRDLLIITEKGQTIRMSLEKLRPLKRSTSGVKLMSVKNGDIVSTMAII